MNSNDHDRRAPPDPLTALEAIEATLWQHLQRAVTDPGDDWHWPVLASVDARSASPQADARVVVLRAVDPQELMFEVHSDRRAHKLAQLRQSPQASLVFHDRLAGVQLRVQAQAHIHVDDAPAHAAWMSLRESSREQYRAPRTPGEPLPQPDLNRPASVAPGHDAPACGFEHFACIVLQAHTLEWLRIDRLGHERARFTRDRASGRRLAAWIRP